MSFVSKQKKKQYIALTLLLALALIAIVILPTIRTAAIEIQDDDVVSVGAGPKTSHRLVVQLESPALAETEWFARSFDGVQSLQATAAQAYVSQLQAEQATFISQLSQVLPGASVTGYIDEMGQSVDARYQVVINAVAVDPGATDLAQATRALSQMPGVKAVFPDYAYEPMTYTSTHLINAPALWAQVGGQANAGAGVKVASMDGGIHHEADMFDGAGWSYPAGWPAGGLGDAANNNGKIIASRAYFRAWDPPSVGDENTWPGTQGTSHGVHTSSTAAGNIVESDYLGITNTLSGVAPGAWLMSYRVFYNSVTNNGSFYLVEGLAALEDLVLDGADVVNNSWGGGPGSVGGEFDPLDMALITASNAGVFVSMSAGNAGPGDGTTDHPSGDYINVAASTTGGTYASGRLSVSAPTPVSATLQNMSYAAAAFGPSLPLGQVISYTFVTALSVDASNFEGCNAWPAGAFTGKAAIISRGACQFGVKVLNAEQAGATFVIVHNHAKGGDSLVNMTPGAVGNQTTISSIFIGNTDGLGMVDWYAQEGDDSGFEINTVAFQVGNTPDRIARFSSRGPGAGNVLKPDIAAPGVNILAQGNKPSATGEDRHLGYGQASGTSMAAPHVAGAAAVLRQIHPAWSNADIKSALMSTAKYIDVYNFDDTPAQPLDMGAGRLDLTNAADPGVILDPPSLSFGALGSADTKSIQVAVTSVAAGSETYDLSTLYTGNGFAITQTTVLTGFVVSPISITIAPGATEWFTVTFDAAASQGVGENQGYIVIAGDSGHDAHMAAWARVEATMGADVLIIDNDFSALRPGFTNYIGYYTSTLETMGMSYDVWSADAHSGNPTTIPEAAVLSAYKVVIYFTGDNYFANGSQPFSTPLTALDMNLLTEYANQGGILIAMGQDLSSVMGSAAFDGGNFFYSSVLGGNWIKDSVTASGLPNIPVRSRPDASPAMQDIILDLSGPAVYTGTFPMPQSVNLGYNIYLPIVSGGSGPTLSDPPTAVADFTYDSDSNRLDYKVQITATDPVTITGVHIHAGSIVEVGPILYSLFSDSQMITDTVTFEGSLVVDSGDSSALLNGETYLNIHTEERPSGAIRSQVLLDSVDDGAFNQKYIDEIETYPNLEPGGGAGKAYAYTPLLVYPGPHNAAEGTVAMGHREQPSLEVPGTSYFGRSIYTTFGLEGINDTPGFTSRTGLLTTFMDWAMDEPTAVISDVTATYTNTSLLTFFQVTLSSNITGTEAVSHRWDFGDGSPYQGPYASADASHAYATCGNYTVRVEVIDSWGNVAVVSEDITVVNCATP